MKLPILQKIDIQDISKESLNSLFERSSIGMIPTILILDQGIITRRELFVKNCLEVFKTRGLNPYFPFPCYILSPEKIKTPGLPQIYTIEEAPKHFIKKIKRIKNREQTLLTKADTYQSRLQNQSITEDLKYLTRKREHNRKLRDLCSEKKFCISLLERIKSPHSES